MPTYEFRCRSCDATFTESRPMAASGDPAECPTGHSDTVRLLSVAGSVSSDRRPEPLPVPAGGGCCGGACRS